MSLFARVRDKVFRRQSAQARINAQRPRGAHWSAEVDGRRFNFTRTPSGQLVMREHRKRRTVTIEPAELVALHDRLAKGSLNL